MADYQEYRRRILHRRWRRMFITAALLILLVLLAAVGVLWKRLHREPAPNTAQGPTILQQELTGSEWNTISYTPARRLSVQTLDNGMTAMDFRLAAQSASPAVERSSFSDVSFLGDSLTQGMQLYDTGLPNAHFCAYKGVGPNAVVNNTTCRRADGEKEVPMEALASQQPRALYILLGTNVLTADSDYTSFLTYYRLMLDMISQALPNTKIYVQSITPVRPEVRKKSPGLYKERLCEINDALSAIALEKGCTFLNLWEALADENGDLIEEYALSLIHILVSGFEHPSVQQGQIIALAATGGKVQLLRLAAQGAGHGGTGGVQGLFAPCAGGIETGGVGPVLPHGLVYHVCHLGSNDGGGGVIQIMQFRIMQHNFIPAFCA